MPNATILGGSDLYVDLGSTINLTCAIKFSPEPSSYNDYIIWYHQDRVINNESPRGGIRIYTDVNDMTVSYLLIQDADQGDTGKYTCAPSNTPASSIKVHVLNGERTEAMQTGASSSPDIKSFLLILFLFTLSSCYNSLNFTKFINKDNHHGR